MVDAQTLLAAALAATVAFIPLARWRHGTPLHAIGAAFILFPVLDDLLSFVRIAPLLGEYTVLNPYTPARLAEIPVDIARENLLVPLVGIGIVALLGGHAIARGHLGTLTRGSRRWGQELWLGWAVLPAFVAAEAIALVLLQGPASFLQTGDETALFANATLGNVLALSIVPALAEELYYRGLLQRVLERRLPVGGQPWTAIGLQGVLFGLAHGGFGTFSHLLGPLMFGLAMGYVSSTLGLGACVVIHAGVNLFYFGLDPGAGSTELVLASLALTAAGLAVAWTARRTLVARVRSGPQSSRAA